MTRTSTSRRTVARPTEAEAEILRREYPAGRSTYDLAPELGRSPQWVSAALRHLGVPTRKRGTPSGRRAGSVGYSAHHWRVRKERGTPSECSVCGTTEDRTYHWANLTGRYEDVQDYARMCVPCHRKYDNARRAKESPSV